MCTYPHPHPHIRIRIKSLKLKIVALIPFFRIRIRISVHAKRFRKKWLGEPFYTDADRIRKVSPKIKGKLLCQKSTKSLIELIHQQPVL